MGFQATALNFSDTAVAGGRYATAMREKFGTYILTGRTEAAPPPPPPPDDFCTAVAAYADGGQLPASGRWPAVSSTDDCALFESPTIVNESCFCHLTDVVYKAIDIDADYDGTDTVGERLIDIEADCDCLTLCRACYMPSTVRLTLSDFTDSTHTVGDDGAGGDLYMEINASSINGETWEYSGIRSDASPYCYYDDVDPTNINITMEMIFDYENFPSFKKTYSDVRDDVSVNPGYTSTSDRLAYRSTGGAEATGWHWQHHGFELVSGTFDKATYRLEFNGNPACAGLVGVHTVDLVCLITEASTDYEVTKTGTLTIVRVP